MSSYSVKMAEDFDEAFWKNIDVNLSRTKQAEKYMEEFQKMSPKAQEYIVLKNIKAAKIESRF